MSKTDSPTVDFNLDSYSDADDLTPYAVVLGGKRYEMAHLDGLPAWDVLDGFISGEVAATKQILVMALGDDYEAFRKNPLKKGAFDRLVKNYMTHCGITLGE